MLPDRVSNPGPLTYESGALPIALRGPGCKHLNKTLTKTFFISMITSKLPKDVVIQLEIQKEEGRFNDYIVARERVELHVSATKSESAENHERPLMSSAEALVAGVQATGNRQEKMRTHSKCRYCSENHWSDGCEKYITIEERK